MAGKNKGKKSSLRSDGVVAENRKARHQYTIEDTVEAGLALTGTEVKSLRAGRANIAEAHAVIDPDGAKLLNADFPPYTHGNLNNHPPRRPRPLLLHKKEMEKLRGLIQREGMTLVPLKLYFNNRGIAKLLLGLAKGKKMTDRRETVKKRDWERDKGRLMRNKG
ncbi:MAG: SsrA-binding protein SmpB [Alphaproteobacteria bacterium]